MKKYAKGEVVLSAYEIQANRLNKLEYARLQRNVNIMYDDLKTNLNHLQREVFNIRDHYTNVVKYVKSKPKYEQWKQEQRDNGNWSEILKHRQKSRFNPGVKFSSYNDNLSEEGVRPLLILIENEHDKAVEPIINFEESFIRPITSISKKISSNLNGKRSSTTIFKENSNVSMPRLRTQQSEQSRNSFFSSSSSSSSTRKFDPIKIMTNAMEKSSNLDTLYKIALQNQTAYKSVEQIHVEKRKLVDKEFASQHRALKGTMRSTGLIN